jgi:Carbohydrate family 9 binding domain-like
MLACVCGCKNQSTPIDTLPDLPTDRTAIPATKSSILLDGNGKDEAWQELDWRSIDQVWLGSTPLDTNDFAGRYKVAYDGSFLYVLAEIKDDVIQDTHPNGLERYWDDDCLEVFIDEDGSGGGHQYNHNAFAYHLALDGKVVDIAPDSSFQYFDKHVDYKRTNIGNTSTWECAFRVFKSDYIDFESSVPVFLKRGKQMGFMLAYCDNDKSIEREHFIGSIPVGGTDKNRGWIDANLFEKVVLGD